MNDGLSKRSAKKSALSKRNKKERRENRKIVASAAVKTGLSFVPLVGGGLVELLNGGQELVQRRQDRMLKILVDRHGVELEDLKARLDKDDDLADLVMRGLDAARKANFGEKLEILADVIAGSVEPESPDRLYARVLFQILEVIEREHIQVLLAIKDWPKVPEGLPRSERWELIPTVRNIASRIPHLKPIVGVLTEFMTANGLITNVAEGTLLGTPAAEYAVGDLGNKLLSYLKESRS